MAGLPTVAVLSGAEHVSELTETLVFTLVPVFVGFFRAQSTEGFGELQDSFRPLAPALAGVAGAALILPLRVPHSGVGQTWLGALLVAAGVSGWASIQLHNRLASMPVLPAAAFSSASVFLCAAPLAFTHAGQLSSWNTSMAAMEVLKDLLFDGPITLLTVWLLREMFPIAFSSRYVLVLAVTIAESYFLLRPQASWTTGLGLLLLLCSGVWLLLADFRGVS